MGFYLLSPKQFFYYYFLDTPINQSLNFPFIIIFQIHANFLYHFIHKAIQKLF